MKFNTQVLNSLNSLNFFKQNQEIVISKDSKAYAELNKAGIHTDRISTKDRKKNLLEKYYKEKIIILKKQDKKDKIQKKIRNINLKNRIQSQPSKEKQKWTKRLEKAIINNKIEFYFDNNKSNYVTGIWNKFLYFSKPKNWDEKQNKIAFPNTRQQQLINELKSSPVFVVENIFNEIVTGESKNTFYKNFIEKLEAKYYNLFLLQDQDELKEPCKIAFVFTNPQDAVELKEYLQEQFPYSAYEIKLSVKIMSLSEFYELSRTAKTMNQIRIIPDIKDLGNLLSKFRKKRHIQFHKRQVYGNNFFQGQPIYRLMPSKTNEQTIENKSRILNYTPKDDFVFQNEIIYYFTDLQDAEKAWDSFYIRYSKLGIPKKAIIEVYNLESLLLDYEKNLEGTPNQIRIIPTKQAKTFIEEAYKSELNKEFSLKNYKIFSRIQIGAERFMWGLTHRTAPEKYPAKWW